MVGLVHCAPEASRENFNEDVDSTQQDEPLYDDEDDNDEDYNDEDNDDDDGGGDGGDDGGDDDDDDDDEVEDQEEEGMKRRSADVEFDDPAGGSTGVDTSTDTISGATDGGKDKQGGAPSAGNSCTNKPLKSKCGKPHLPKYGGVKLNGHILSYYCHKGYALHGAKWNKCVGSHRKYHWSYRTPQCKRSRFYRT
ncbi:hypothetical protein EMCRGX_G028835 [Ephydatia muelleri]